MVGMEENLSISLSLGTEWVMLPRGWGFQVVGASKWMRGPSMCFSSGVQVGEGSKCVF